MEGLERLYPADEYKLYGPYTRKDDNRCYYVLAELIDGKVTRQSKKSAVMRARLMMEIHLGRRLKTSEEVDHIDDDCTNDVLTNLQVLPKLENARKDNKRKKREWHELECPCCKKTFVTDDRQFKMANAKGRIPCCSRVCASKYYGANQYVMWVDGRVVYASDLENRRT